MARQTRSTPRGEGEASSSSRARYALPADVTITFHAPKHGHFRSPAKEATGKLLVADIGVWEAF